MSTIDRLLNAVENVIDVVPKCLPTAIPNHREAATKMIVELREAFHAMNRERHIKSIEDAAADRALRDHFAGLAMPMAFKSYTEQRRQDEGGKIDAVSFEDDIDMAVVAESAYYLADAMLAARQK